MAILVRDLSGRPCFYLEGEVARDDSGKKVAARTGADDQARRMSTDAAGWMSGRKVLMDLGIADVITPSTQADFGIPSGDCIADAVSEVRYVKHDRGVWYQESPLDAIKVVSGVAAEDGNVAEINPSYAANGFTTTGYAVAVKIPKRVAANADFPLFKRALRRVVEALRLSREFRIATMLTTSGNWASSNVVTISSGTKWNGGATANPLVNMFSGLGDSVLPANVLVLPEVAAQYFFQNANSQAMRDYVQSGGEMPKVLFARAKYSVSGAPAYVWAPSLPANVAMVRVSDDPETDTATTQTFRWLGEDGVKDGERIAGMLARRFTDATDPESEWIVVTHNDAEVFVSNVVGACLVGALQ